MYSNITEHGTLATEFVCVCEREKVCAFVVVDVCACNGSDFFLAFVYFYGIW